MAKTKSIDLGALERRARQALGRLPWWDPSELPASYQTPGVYRLLIEGAAADLPPSVAAGKPFQSAMSAVSAWSAAADLRERAMALLDHPAIREVAGSEQNLRYLVQNPDEAMALLVQHSVAHPRAYRDGPLAEALAVAGEATTFFETHSDGSAEEVSASAAPRPAPQRPPQPKPAPGHEQGASAAVTRPAPIKPATASYDELVAKPHLSKAEYAQLLEWTEEDLKIENAIEGGGSDDDNN